MQGSKPRCLTAEQHCELLRNTQADLSKRSEQACRLRVLAAHQREAEAWIDEQTTPGDYYIHETHGKVGGRVSGLAA